MSISLGWDISKVRDEFMSKLVDAMAASNAKWPKILWGNAHKWGLLKFTDKIHKTQSGWRAEVFNQALQVRVSRFKIQDSRFKILDSRF